ncbi:Hypp8652 [Branchiostoma lanceolatum]|uniref:Hypp8652 protein n=1 Tax=Branchiostoma lanceolatum TaxID=7740 RepID=A0A8J9Z847_BRALA|nr:Hypp8652 [Branchiostoma lanceolatum]
MTSFNIKVPRSVDDVSLPWLQQVLNTHNSRVNVTDVVITGPMRQAQGSISSLLAVVARGTGGSENEDYELVVKLTRVQEDVPKKVVTLEEREVSFYSIAVPDLNSVLCVQTLEGTQSIDTDNQSCKGICIVMPLPVPKCYFATSDQSSMMSVRVLENLETRGFTVKPFPEPLSLEETIVAVRALAQIHGLSHLMEHRTGAPLSERYHWLRDTAKERATSRHHERYEAGVKAFASAFPDRPDLAARLGRLTAEVLFTGREATTGTPRVLCHGDCWNDNIMFKYDQGLPVSAMLLDWQHACYRRPTYDLACLLVYTTTRETRQNHTDDILYHYHQQLQHTLGHMEETRLRSYTLEDLRADLRADLICPVARWLMGSWARPLYQYPQLLHCVEDIGGWGVI